MRIAIITYVLDYKSGARAVIELAKALAQRGHNIELICTPLSFNAQLATQLNSPQIHIHKVPHPLALYFFLRRLKPQVISFNGILSQLLICRITHIKIYSHYYGTQFVSPFVNPFIYLKSWLLVWLPHSLYGISNYCSIECRKLYFRKITTIYQGCNHLPMPTSLPRKKMPSVVSLLSISRFVPYKGFDRLIKIVADLPVTLTIAGSRSNPGYLDYLKKISTPKIKFLTDISDRQLINLYSQTDIYLSADRYLFLGLPILEAATFGIPTVTMAYAAAPEVVIHATTGFVANSELEFKHFLRQLVTNIALRQKLGSNAKRHATKFSWHTFAKNLEREYLHT